MAQRVQHLGVEVGQRRGTRPAAFGAHQADQARTRAEFHDAFVVDQLRLGQQPFR